MYGNIQPLIKGRERKIQDIRETNQEKKNQRYGKRRKVIQKERRVDALALRADERRDKLRKAVGRSKYPKSHRYLNGETWLGATSHRYMNP